MKSLVDYIIESMANNLKSMTNFLSGFEFEPSDIKGWRFKKDSYKTSKKPKNEFKISIKDAHNFTSGNSDRYEFYIYNVYVFIKPFEFEVKHICLLYLEKQMKEIGVVEKISVYSTAQKD